MFVGLSGPNATQIEPHCHATTCSNDHGYYHGNASRYNHTSSSKSHGNDPV